jgi:hypothetical protein
MNQIETKHMIAVLADHFMVSNPQNRTDPTKMLTSTRHLRDGNVYGIYFAIDYDMHNYGYEKDGNTHHKDWVRNWRKTVHVIVTQRHNVFVCVKESRGTPTLEDWINSSNHDSCWRSDGLSILDQVGFDAYEHCFGWMPDEHRPIPMCASTHVQFANWHFGRSPFEIVKLRGEYNDGDYRYRLTGFQKMEHGLNITGM